MLWTLIQREILANLMTFRFPIAVITCVILGLTITAALTDNYERRLASYNEAFQTHQEKKLQGQNLFRSVPTVESDHPTR